MKKEGFFKKFHKTTEKKDGSALVFVMLAISILAILGTVLVSMSIVNMEMKRSGIVVKKNRYYSESGIDQVYAKVSDEVLEAIRLADAAADGVFKDKLSKIEEILTNPYTETFTTINEDGEEVTYEITVIKPSEHPECASYVAAGFLKHNGGEDYSIVYGNKDEPDKGITAEAQREFERIFKEHIKANITSDFIKESTSLYVDKDDSMTAEIEVDSVDILDFDADVLDVFQIKNIESEIKYKNKDEIKKTVHVDINISIPKKVYDINPSPSEYDIANNPIWRKSLVAYNDIDVLGFVEATGDVYGFGRKRKAYEEDEPDIYADPREFGGVLVSGGGNLVVNGNLISREYVQIKDNSTGYITVNNGFVHTDTLITQEGSRGKIYVEGDVYTKDDLELNGNRSTIDINGNYYGYSDDAVGSTRHDTSSAIVINATRPTASLIIRGNSYNKYKGSIINGVSFINKYNKYKTGESVSFRDNTFVYSWDFNTDLFAFTEDEDEMSTLDLMKEDTAFMTPAGAQKYNCISRGDKEAALNGGFFSNPNFGGTDTVKMPTNREKDFKKAYFLAFQEYADYELEALSRGNKNVKGPKVNINNYLSTTGLRLYNGEFNLGDNSAMNTQNASKGEDAKIEFSEDFIYLLNELEERDGRSTSATVSEANPINKFIKTIPDESHIDIREDKTLRCVSVKDKLIINGSPQNNSDSIDLSDAYYTGVIYAEGNIEINGVLRFNGPIISKGKIIFKSGTDAKIVNDLPKSLDYEDTKNINKNKIGLIIAEDKVLRELFNANSLDNYNFKIDKANVQEFSQFDKKQKYDSFISLGNWQVVEE